MMKKFLFLPLLLIAVAVNGEPVVRVVGTSGASSSFATDDVHKLVLSSTAMDVVSTEGSVLLSVLPAELARVEFADGEPSNPTTVDQVQNNNLQATKVLRDGQLIILHNGTMYNVQGQVIKNE